MYAPSEGRKFSNESSVKSSLWGLFGIILPLGVGIILPLGVGSGHGPKREKKRDE